jgi:hypothetical protein
VEPEGMRQIYQTLIIPQLLYCSAAWFDPANPDVPAVTQNKIVRSFAAIQKRAALLIGGASKDTAAEALNTELHILPIKLQFQRRAGETAVRIITGPRVGGRPTESQSGRNVSHNPIEHHLRKGCLTLHGKEQWERREAYARPPWQAHQR